jgi:hypothetical protein
MKTYSVEGQVEELPVSKPSRPDITPAQIVAGIPILAALLSAFGVYDLAPVSRRRSRTRRRGRWPWSAPTP